MRHALKQKGFTLIEMAFVLVIIGLIIAAISIAKDTQRQADYRKIAQQFVRGWTEAYNKYYERTGVVIGDVQPQDGQPTGQVGGSLATSPITDAPDIQDLMDHMGIIYPVGSGQGRENIYVYHDNKGVPHQLKIWFEFVGGADGGSAGGLLGNVMVFQGVTVDLGRSVDSALDGTIEGTQGRFRLLEPATTGVKTNTQNAKAIVWPNAENEGAAEKEFLAIYQMEQ